MGRQRAPSLRHPSGAQALIWVYLAFFFVIAIAADWLTIRWHEAREAEQILRVMRLSAIIEAINWAPLVFAIDSDILSAGVIAAINIAGTTIGSGGAMYRMRLKKAKGRNETSTS